MSLLTVGKIINTHGIRGELKVVRISDFEERFTKGNQLELVNDKNEIQKTLTISKHRVHKGFDLIQFKEISDLTTAELYKNHYLKIKKDQLTPLDKDEYYYYEIIGLMVETTSGEQIGKIKEILSPGANDVWVVSRENEDDVLIPYIREVVKKVSLDTKKVVIEPMEGLLD